jgi:hypothetical protein
MTALDLTKAPPRSPREELRGLCMLPRMIDIARAKLPGGDVGEYQIGISDGRQTKNNRPLRSRTQSWQKNGIVNCRQTMRIFSVNSGALGGSARG